MATFGSIRRRSVRRRTWRDFAKSAISASIVALPTPRTPSARAAGIRPRCNRDRASRARDGRARWCRALRRTSPHAIDSRCGKAGWAKSLSSRSRHARGSTSLASSAVFRVDSSLLIDEARAPMLRRGELLILATGAQGERQGALTRVATANDVGFRCRAGDRLILSTRVIPGNERAVESLSTRSFVKGLMLFPDKMAMVHCSGHACWRSRTFDACSTALLRARAW